MPPSSNRNVTIAQPGQVFREAQEDTTLDGAFIPKGTIVHAALFHIHRDPTLWSDPDSFVPERWLPALKQERSADLDSEEEPGGGSATGTSANKNNLFTFGQGPRMCLGMHWAVRTIKHTIIALYRSYDVTVVGNQELQFSQFLALVPDPVRIVLQQRVR